MAAAHAETARTPELAAERVAPSIAARDGVLVKGSRGIRMERAVAALCASTTTIH
jgi:UDP-N-acetylmuramyl pentapeptide synthase